MCAAVMSSTPTLYYRDGVTSGVMPASEQSAILARMNEVRALFGAAPMVWDDSLLEPVEELKKDEILRHCDMGSHTSTYKTLAGQVSFGAEYNTSAEENNKPDAVYGYNDLVASPRLIVLYDRWYDRFEAGKEPEPYLLSRNLVQTVWKVNPSVACLMCDGPDPTKDAPEARYSAYKCLFAVPREDAYIAGNTSRENTPVDLCSNVLCPDKDCHEPNALCSEGVCQYLATPDGTACPSGTCGNGACVVSLCAGVVCRSEGPCKDEGVCEEATGECVYTNRPQGTACDDQIDDTQGEVCDGYGYCLGLNPCTGRHHRCDSSSLCTESKCDFSTLECVVVNKPDGSECSTGDYFMNIEETCQNGRCAGPKACSSADDCITTHRADCRVSTTCDVAQGLCVVVYEEDGAPCDDEHPHTHDDKCRNGGCVGIVPCDWMECPPATSVCDFSICYNAVCYNVPKTGCTVPAPVTDKGVLLTLKSSLTDPTQTSGKLATWTGDDVCAWGGVACHGDGSVSKIDLTDEPLAPGATVPDLDGFDKLSTLYVSGTNITGFGKLPTSLKELEFSKTKIDGPFPDVLTGLDNLITLRARGAGMTGALPVFPDNLYTVDVSDNAFEGPITLPLPSQINNFIVRNNKLTGGLPPSDNVLRMIVNNNQLSGPMLVYPRLLVGFFHFNDLSGGFVSSMTPVASTIDLTANGFNGALPNLVGSQITAFKASHNSFTGPFHFATVGQEPIDLLEVNNNKLTGAEPTEAECERVATVCRVRDNTFD